MKKTRQNRIWSIGSESSRTEKALRVGAIAIVRLPVVRMAMKAD
jgi:hypothetical protein